MKSLSLSALMVVASLTPVAAQSLTRNPETQSISPQAGTDPLKVIYRVSGLIDDGGADNSGVASVVTCTNFSSTSENLRFVILHWDGSQKKSVLYTMNPRKTSSISTHETRLFGEDFAFNSGPLSQGVLVISATTTNVHCTVSVIDAAATKPQGFDLHMVRFNPHPGSVE